MAKNNLTVSTGEISSEFTPEEVKELRIALGLAAAREGATKILKESCFKLLSVLEYDSAKNG